VVVGGRVKFGDGRATLLERIDELGSLRQAVAGFGMSYRAAWGYFRELERAAGFAFLARRPGGQAGMRLTADARHFLRRYRGLQRGLERALERHFVRAFGDRQ
jgi:molybdate transport system regulatory protein